MTKSHSQVIKALNTHNHLYIPYIAEVRILNLYDWRPELRNGVDVEARWGCLMRSAGRLGQPGALGGQGAAGGTSCVGGRVQFPHRFNCRRRLHGADACFTCVYK